MDISDSEIQKVENELRSAQLNASEEKLRSTQQQVYMEENLKGTISEQLDLDEQLEKIGYLLKGWVEETINGEKKWVQPKDNEMRILSDYGVHLIKNVIQFYLNKNTLLSNYDEVTINKKMEDFSNSLNDDIFMEYDKVFLYPSLEDCQKVFDKRLKRRRELKIYALKVLGKKVDEAKELEIKKEILEDAEFVIEKELEKIREQLMKNKLKRFELLIRCIQDTVHSAYQRAWKGQERTTLRQHINISEHRGAGNIVPQPSASPLNWFKKR